jgi:hypothetical protein
MKAAVGKVKQERIYTKAAFRTKGFGSKGCRTCRPGIPPLQLRSNAFAGRTHESAAGSLGRLAELSSCNSSKQFMKLHNSYKPLMQFPLA